MARFYARFDGASVTALDNDYFDKRQIADASTVATALRNDLLTARENLSSALKAELNLENTYGVNGPIIPRDVNNITLSGGSLEWNNVYTTTTIPGIVTPADYRTRPTGSPATTDGQLTARDPADNGTISATVYTTAANKLMDVLNSISANSPSTASNQGNYPSRTLHSLWHDYDVRYFGWDNFTPGSMSTSGMDIQFSPSDCSPSANVSTIQFTWSNTLSYAYKNDGNPSGKIGIAIEVVKASGATGTCDSNWNVARFILRLGFTSNEDGGPLVLGTATSGNGPTNPSTATGCSGTSTWTWNGFGGYNAGGVPNLTWTVKLEDCLNGGYDITVSTKLFDVTITDSTNGGQPGIYSEQGAVPNPL